MKRVVVFISILLMSSFSFSLWSQSWLRQLGRRVAEKAQETVADEVVETVEDAIEDAWEAGEDATRSGVKNAASKKKNKKNTSVQEDEYEDEAETETTESPQEETAKKSQKKVASYAKSDFVAGDEIFFEDNQMGEQLGEFPSQWDMDYGNAEIAQMGDDKCIMTIGYTAIMPLIADGKNYLPEQFTIEFDIYPQNCYETDNASDHFEIGLNDNRTLIARFHTGRSDGAYLGTDWRKPNDDSGHSNSDDNNVYFSYDEWHHVALSFNKRACKIYVDGVRVVNIPNMRRPTSMWIWSNQGQAYFKNFRIAKGAVPLYDRMVSEGKFITYGITFDVGKSTIRPESYGEINRIVKLMTDNPTIKFSVEGHTDNTGNTALNQTLSEQRSQAIVAKLVEMGITQDRLTAVGKGQNNPIADNSTDEGRAKNRRVEFVVIDK